MRAYFLTCEVINLFIDKNCSYSQSLSITISKGNVGKYWIYVGVDKDGSLTNFVFSSNKQKIYKDLGILTKNNVSSL